MQLQIKKNVAMLWPRTQMMTAAQAQQDATLWVLFITFSIIFVSVFAFALSHANTARTAAAFAAAAESEAEKMIASIDEDRVALMQVVGLKVQGATYCVVDKEGIWELPASEEKWAEKVLFRRPEGEQAHNWLLPKDPEFTRADQVLGLRTYTRYNECKIEDMVGNASIRQQNHLAALRGERVTVDLEHEGIQAWSKYFLSRN